MKEEHIGLRRRKQEDSSVSHVATGSSTSSVRQQAGVGKPKKPSSLPLVFGTLVLLVGCCYMTYFSRSRALLPPNMAKMDPVARTFSTDRAMAHVKKIAKVPHLVGTHAWAEAATYIKNQIQSINPENGLILEVESSTASGSHHRIATKLAMAVQYNQVTSIVARLRPEHMTDEGALLINAHFDSVQDAPGAADNAVGVGAAIEVLRTMSLAPGFKLKRPIIFLWNGAEEYGLSGADGFISSHRWAPTVKAHINLEAMGTGSRYLLFRAGPNNGWLLDAYARAATMPYAHVTGMDVFETNLIPADTDYTIFSKAGIPGYDFGIMENGKVYHTKYDSIEFAKPAAARHIGQSIMIPLITELAGPNDAIGKASKDPSTRRDAPVFLDVFGIFVLVCSERVSSVLAIAILVGWAFSARSQLSRQAVLVVGAALVGAFGAVAVMVILYTYAMRLMAWYFSTVLAVVMFAPPGIWGALVGLSLTLKKMPNMSRAQAADEIGCASLILYVVATASLVVISKKSFVFPAFVLASFFLAKIVKSYSPNFPLLYCIIIPLPSLALIWSGGFDLLLVAHGVLGRIGDAPIDWIMAGLVTFFTVLCWVLPMLQFCVHYQEGLPRLRCLFRAVIIITAVVVALIPEATLPHLHSVYARDSPKRMLVVRHFQANRQPQTILGVSSCDPTPLELRSLLYRLSLSKNDTLPNGKSLIDTVKPYHSFFNDWSVFDLDERGDDEGHMLAPTIEITSDSTSKEKRDVTVQVTAPSRSDILGVRLALNSSSEYGEVVEWSLQGRPSDVQKNGSAFILVLGKKNGRSSLDLSMSVVPSQSSGSLNVKLFALSSASGAFSEANPLSRLNLAGWMAPEISDTATAELTI